MLFEGGTKLRNFLGPVNDVDLDTGANCMESSDVVLTQDQTDTLAERIAAVLRERKKVGAQRRMRLPATSTAARSSS